MLVKLVTAQLSSEVGAVQVTSAEQGPKSLFWVMSEGIPDMVGSSVSFTITAKLSEWSLPAASTVV